MPVNIGEVTTFANPQEDKAQVLKIAEECCEVFSAWETYTGMTIAEGEQSVISRAARNALVDECADVITATCNLLAALGVDDMREAMRACEARNRERGRL